MDFHWNIFSPELFRKEKGKLKKRKANKQRNYVKKALGQT